MWPLKSLHDIVTLLQEQNALMRELIVALTKHPATTPSRTYVSFTEATKDRPRAKLTREYTSKDVTVVTAEMREQQAIALFEKTERPWRIQDLPPEAQAAALAMVVDVDTSPVHQYPLSEKVRAQQIAQMNEVTLRIQREAQSTSAPSATAPLIPRQPPTR